MVHDTMWRKLLNVLPHGYNMAEEDWQRRHRLMLWVLGVHVPALVAFGLVLGYPPRTLVYVVITPVAAVTLGYMLRRHRRTASVTVTGRACVLLGGARRAHTRRHRGALPLLHHHRVHRALPGLGAAPLQHHLHRDQPRDRLGVATDVDLRSRRGAGGPVAVVGDPRCGGADGLRRSDRFLAVHRGVPAREGHAGPQARRFRDQPAAVHRRPAHQPRPPQPEPAAPAAGDHQPDGGVRAGPRRAVRPVRAGSHRHPRAAQRREPARALRRATAAHLE